MVMRILTDINNCSDINYINFSHHNNYAGLAPVASMVMHSSNKRGPDRHSGSIPDWGGPALKS